MMGCIPMKENKVIMKGVSVNRDQAGNIEELKNVLKSFFVFERLIRCPINFAILIIMMSSEVLRSQIVQIEKR